MLLSRAVRALSVPSGLHWFALLLAFLNWLPCHAKQTTATVLGAVVDSSGAAVVGVKVSASSLATNIQRETVTDQAGNYTLPSLPAGDYRVTATREGFQVQRIDKVTLQVEQSARLDFTLKIGNISETIEVNASAVVVQTENASGGTVIHGGQIVDLPLNGRHFTPQSQLTPGEQAAPPGSLTIPP